MLSGYVPYDITRLSDARLAVELETHRRDLRRAWHRRAGYMIYVTSAVLAMYEEEARWRTIEYEAFGAPFPGG